MVIDSSFYAILAYKSFLRNTLLSVIRVTCNQFSSLPAGHKMWQHFFSPSDKLLLPCCSIPSSFVGAEKPLPYSHCTLGTQNPGKMVHLVYLQSLSISLPIDVTQK